MAAVVTTVNDEDELATLIGGTVLTFDDEQTLNTYLLTITTETLRIVAKGGGKYTVSTDATATFFAAIANPLLAKGIKYTVILDV